MEIGATSYSTRVVAPHSRVTSNDRARSQRTGLSQPDESKEPQFRSKSKEPLKVGFGNDSVKVPNLAANTIKRNVRQAEELIPSLRESEERVRNRIEKDERNLTEQDNRAEQRRLDFRASQQAAVGSTRSFVSSVNYAAGEALVRTGQSEPAQTNRLDIRIGDTQIPYDKPDTRQPLDLFA
ncbi:MAG: hypothetical protein IT366_00070 [Candidatus Hydrogenedentes bacterium]|nr:hypothetical protein [Candidatus Hydrogenedentota bacterium]